MFIAPATGTYRFLISSDDQSELYISSVANSTNTTNL
jgi:hypothetical protein